MNARALCRVFLAVGMATVVGASVYGLSGVSSAASSPQPASADVVKTVPVTFGVVNQAGKTIRRGTGVAKVVRLGSAAAKQPGVAKIVRRFESAASKRGGAAAPDAGVGGPSTVCLAFFYYNVLVSAGGWSYVNITFPSAPFVVGSMFNETFYDPAAQESVYSSGVNVQVTALNNADTPYSQEGYYGVLYWDGGC
jgi:hypothetical protein